MDDSNLPSIQLDADALGELELYLGGALEALFAVNVGAAAGSSLLLRDSHNVRIGVLTVAESGESRCRGTVRLLQRPHHIAFMDLRRLPFDIRVWAPDGMTSAALGGFPSVETVTRIRTSEDRAVVHLLELAPIDIYARVRAARRLFEENPNVMINILPVSGRDPVMLERVQRACGAKEILQELSGPVPPEIEDIVRNTIPAKLEQGFCIWFTGLPSAGKSTIAERVCAALREAGRRVTILDGDVVRTHLSKGLGFSREDRDTNIRRIGWVAAEIVRHGGVAIAAAVSPYQQSRDDARHMVGANFILVYVATPPEVCEIRDVKGFYAQARAGALQGMTGVNDPYEPPTNAQLTLQTMGTSPEENALRVVEYLRQQGFLTDTIVPSV